MSLNSINLLGLYLLINFILNSNNFPQCIITVVSGYTKTNISNKLMQVLKGKCQTVSKLMKQYKKRIYSHKLVLLLGLIYSMVRIREY
jgi:hypothetical protein